MIQGEAVAVAIDTRTRPTTEIYLGISGQYISSEWMTKGHLGLRVIKDGTA